ncbi:MAG TPA: hypothetical protein VF405_08440 [Gammaproteobacteria bacterium]
MMGDHAPHKVVAAAAIAVAAALLAIVITLVLRFSRELADAVPSVAPTVVERVEEARTVPADVSAAPANAETAPPSPARCVSSDSARVRRTQQSNRNLGLSGSLWRERLLVSLDAEHLAAAAMMTRNPRSRVEDITRAMAAGSQNAAIVWHAVQICGAAGGVVPCPEREWEEQLLKLDGENSEAWIHVAARRLARGESTAFYAIQRAASAAETNVYWPETVELIERGLDAAGGYPFSARASTAFGVAAANQPDYKGQVAMCKARSEVDRAWADACLRYGQVAEQRRKTVLGQTSARTLQIAVLEAIGDEEATAKVRARVQQGVATADRRRVDALIVSGPRPFERYLAKLSESGELAAVAYMLEEVPTPSPPLSAECIQARRAE